MKKIKIIADSTCDLSQELLEKYDITIVPLYVQLDEESYLDGIEIVPDKLYAWSDKNGKTPKTAAPGIDVVMNIVKQYDREETDIIFFGISETMSTTCNVIRLVAEDLKYDNLYVIDSKNLCAGIGLQVIRAAELAKEGRTAQEIVSLIERDRDKVSATFVLDTLTYLQRGGRCSAMTALMAGALKIKPMIAVSDGKMDVAKKYRGNMNAVVKKYLADLEENLKTADDSRVFLCYSGSNEEQLKMAYTYLEGLHYFKEIHTIRAGSVISSHCGPKTLGIMFYHK